MRPSRAYTLLCATLPEPPSTLPRLGLEKISLKVSASLPLSRARAFTSLLACTWVLFVFPPFRILLVDVSGCEYNNALPGHQSNKCSCTLLASTCAPNNSQGHLTATIKLFTTDETNQQCTHHSASHFSFCRIQLDAKTIRNTPRRHGNALL